MAHWLPIHWWKSMVPWVVCAVKLGASSPIRKDIGHLLFACEPVNLTPGRASRQRGLSGDGLTPRRSDVSPAGPGGGSHGEVVLRTGTYRRGILRAPHDGDVRPRSLQERARQPGVR